MAPFILAILLLVLVAGILFTYLGFRGRRINDHPVCKQCNFDLHGAYPEVVTCPECGAGLKRPGCVRIGARKKIPTLAFCGVLFILASFVPVGIMGYAALTGTNIDSRVPLGFLLWESKYFTGQRSKEIAGELMNRMTNNTAPLTPAQVDAIVEAALARQADLTKPWDEQWGDLIDRAKFDNVLKPELQARYYEHAGVFELKTRPTTYPGAELPVLLELKEARVGSTASIDVPIYLKSATLGDAAIKRIETPNDSTGGLSGASPFGSLATTVFSSRGGRLFGGRDPSQPGNYLDTFTVTGSKMRSFGNPKQALAFEVPKKATVGTQPLSLSLDMRPTESQGMNSFMVINGRLSQPRKSGADKTIQTTLTVPVDLKSDSSQICSPIQPNSDSTAAIEKQLKPDTASIDVFSMYSARSTETGNPNLMVQFKTKDTPQPIAYKVFARDPENPSREIELGSISSGTVPTNQGGPFQSMFSSTISISVNGLTTTQSSSSDSDSSTVSAPSPDWLGDTIDIVLKPDPAAAAKTLDQDHYYDKEIIYPKVPVNKAAAPPTDLFDSAFRRLTPAVPPTTKPKRKGAF